MIPGAFPSRVVQILHNRVLRTGQEVAYRKFGRALRYTRRDENVISAMLDAGITRLTGIPSRDEAWLSFCQPGEVIGIKVVPVGGPESLSSYELINAIIENLQRIGIRKRDIVVFDRFKSDFLQFGYDRFLKHGIHWECAAEEFDRKQMSLDGRSGKTLFSTRVSGYSADHSFVFPIPCPDGVSGDAAIFRSHLCNIVARKVDKVISVPVLKDHVASGITFSLKNLSHGLFNNVYRSHRLDEQPQWLRENCCSDFIPAAVSHATVRNKSVLLIGDAIVCTYHAGPGTWNPHFSTCPGYSLFFATDPVALDCVGLAVLDSIRQEHNLVPLADISGVFTDSKYSHTGELYPRRHIDHIVNAARLGLGGADPKHELVDLSPDLFQ